MPKDILTGHIFSTTSIDEIDMSRIVTQLSSMGATVRRDLTSDVTCMIVGKLLSEKYRFVAKHRPEVRMLHPDFVSEAHTLWLKGDDVDLEYLFIKHQTPVFQGLNICITGFSANNQRALLIEEIKQNGGNYHPDLSHSVTHLVASDTTSTKYSYAKKWDIPVVQAAWIHQSLKRNAVLDESYFSLEIPESDVGKGAIEVLATSPQNRALQRHDSHIVKAKRQQSTDKLWSSLVKPEGQLSTEKAQSDDIRKVMGTSMTEPESIATTGLIFSKTTFAIHGFSQKHRRILEKTIRSQGGQIVDVDSTPYPQYIVVPADGDPYLGRVKDYSKPSVLVTEWMIERSLHCKSLVYDFWGSFFPSRNIPELLNLPMCISGFEGVEFMHITKLAKIIGADMQESLKVGVTKLLIVNSANIPALTKKSSKFLLAMRAKIPIVTEQWLWNCAMSDKYISYDTNADYSWRLDLRLHELIKNRPNSDSKKKRDSGKKSILKHSRTLSLGYNEGLVNETGAERALTPTVKDDLNSFNEHATYNVDKIAVDEVYQLANLIQQAKKNDNTGPRNEHSVVAGKRKRETGNADDGQEDTSYKESSPHNPSSPNDAADTNMVRYLDNDMEAERKRIIKSLSTKS
ncbi:hypothetical protein CANCADRAFT_112018 [Tortispora caseinolytica NRRL Y-17796]|uniref:BRCT domain-containing protein n=1 Tax=Tortispora caseinolytica NRRL Y-17796 TaxID=767744 RepID=A0A1E4TGP7_9ASCO|nr:hypothetical protein CANCADRAFT_112018 [Tortispora caseinolytica NRRL Y-17796]